MNVQTSAWAATRLLVVATLAAQGCARQASDGLLPEKAFHTLSNSGGIGVNELVFSGFKTTLQSGMRVACDDTKSRGIMGIVMAIGAGSQDDPEGKEGLAHLVEHLVFRGHAEGDASDRSTRLTMLGGAGTNASTSPDLTTYYSFVGQERAPELMALFLDLLTDPMRGISEDDFSVELEIVKNEYRQRDESGVAGVWMSWMHNALFDAEHPYQRPILGPPEVLNTLTLDDARTFAETHYKVERTAIQLVGDCRNGPDVVETIIPKALRDPESLRVQHVQRQPSMTSLRAPNGPSSPPVQQVDDANRGIVIAWRLPAIFARSGHLTNVVMSQSVRRAMARQLEIQEGVEHAVLVAFRYHQATLVGCFISIADTADRDAITKRSKRIVDDFWRRGHGEYTIELYDGSVYSTGLDDEYMLRQGRRNQAAAEALLGAESYIERAIFRAEFLKLAGDGDGVVGLISRTALATDDKIVNFAIRYLSPKRARVLYTDPRVNRKRRRPGRTGALPRNISDVPDQPGTVARMPNPSTAPAPAGLTQRAQYKLDNGLKVTLLPRKQFPVVSVVMTRKGGTAAAFDPASAVVARRVDRVLGPLIGNASMKYAAADESDLWIDVLATGRDNLANAMAALSGKLRHLDETDWAEILDSSDGEGAPSKENPIQVVRRRVQQDRKIALFGKHGLAFTDTPDVWQKASTEGIQQTLLRYNVPRNTHLLIAGDFDEAIARRLVEMWFGKWTTQPEDKPVTMSPAPITTIPVAKRIRVYDSPNYNQVEIDIACRLPNANKGSHLSYAVLAGVASGWLQKRIREEAGASYGVSPELSIAAGGSAGMTISMKVDAEQLSDILRIARGHWMRFASDGFDDNAISQIRWGLSTSERLFPQTSSSLALMAASFEARGEALDSLGDLANRLTQVTADELATAFSTCARTTIVQLVGDKKRIDDAVSQLR